MLSKALMVVLFSASLAAVGPGFSQDAVSDAEQARVNNRNLILDAIKASGDMIKKAAEYSKTKAGQVWDKTKDISGKSWESTKEVVNDGEHAVKEGYAVIKDKVSDPLNAID